MDQFKSCTTCFVTSRFPGADIDDSGRCRWCRQGQLNKTSPEAKTLDQPALDAAAQRIKAQRHGKYDCIIGVSGGMDSSYVAYITKNLMGLNSLLINYDHGFFYDLPKENIQNLSKALQSELRVIKSKKQWDLKYIKSITSAFSKSKMYWGICTFCHYILPAAVAKIAHDEGIHFVMNSSNDYEGLLHVPKLAKLKAMLKAILGPGFWSIPKMLFYLAISQYYLIRLKLEFYVPPLTNLFKRGPQTDLEQVNLTQFVPWQVDKIKQILKSEVAWQLPSHPNLGMRFDCMIEDSFINHTYKNATGLTIHSIIANNLIYDKLEEKDNLEPIALHYDTIIADRVASVSQKLKEGSS